MALKSYNAAEVSVIVGTRRMSGFAEDSLVSVVRDEQAFTKSVGADGETTRSKTNNKAGTITISLKQSSDSNDFLSTLAITDEATGAGVVPVTVIDNSGRTLCFAQSAWVQKLPDSEFARDSGDREWILDCADLDMTVAGN